jgi:hypothetical protein
VRGLPPLPTDILRLTAYLRVLEGWCSIEQHIWNPGSSTAGIPDLQAFAAQWFFSPLGDLSGICPANTSFSALRLSTSGPAHLTYTEPLAPNTGPFGSVTSLNAAVCLTWLTGEAGTGSKSHTRLPLAEEYIDLDRQSLTAFAYDAAGSAAGGYVSHVNALVAVDGALCVLACVHRSRHGSPLASSTWSPVLDGVASPRVTTLRRRIRSRDRFSPF